MSIMCVSCPCLAPPACLAQSLPRTASNKVMRRVLRDELLHSQSKL